MHSVGYTDVEKPATSSPSRENRAGLFSADPALSCPVNLTVAALALADMTAKPTTQATRIPSTLTPRREEV
jgi:hypothetical protein